MAALMNDRSWQSLQLQANLSVPMPQALAASLRSSDASKCLKCAWGIGKAAMGIWCGKTGVSSCEVNHITILSVSLGICI